MLDALIRYFTLQRAVLGPSGVEKEMILFSGVVAGVIGQWAFVALQGDGAFSLKSLGLGLIASVVTYPAIYHNAGLDQAGITFVKWCTAFQNGFFWPTILSALNK